jgi:hypothetical protein
MKYQNRKKILRTSCIKLKQSRKVLEGYILVDLKFRGQCFKLSSYRDAKHEMHLGLRQASIQSTQYNPNPCF